MNVTINLPEDIRVSRLGVDIDIRVSDIPPAILSRLVEHGLSQKIGDACSGAVKDVGLDGKYSDLSTAEQAKVNAHAEAVMRDVLGQLIAGEWATKRAGSGVSALYAEIRSILRPLVAENTGAAKWKAMDEDARIREIDETFELQDDEMKETLRVAAEEELQKKRDRKAMIGGLAAKLAK